MSWHGVVVLSLTNRISLATALKDNISQIVVLHLIDY